MKRLLYFLPIVFILYLVSLSYGSGTTTIIEETYSSMRKITFEWRADSDGNVDTTSAEFHSAIVWRIVFHPDTGASKPSDNYDVSIFDNDTIDICNRGGFNLPDDIDVQLAPGTISEVEMGITNSPLRLVIADAGSLNAGKVIVYLR